MSVKLPLGHIDAGMRRLIGEHTAQAGKADIIAATTIQQIQALPADLGALVNLEPLNKVERVNKFLEATNAALPSGSVYIGCAETLTRRRVRVAEGYPGLVGRRAAVYADFALHRVAPKLRLTRQAYFRWVKSSSRAMSRSEILGRLVSCGFEILAEESKQGVLVFAARKVTAPTFDLDPSYGALIHITRIGHQGKPVRVYKLRTMHPYSEYLQAYMMTRNPLAPSGKIADDFRVTGWGAALRKRWIDELPMLFNLFKGDLKFIGLRPIGQSYFDQYPAEYQSGRHDVKPGLFPPYYADMPNSFAEHLESEKRYLERYRQAPLLTDTSYFARAIWNIVVKKKRSS